MRSIRVFTVLIAAICSLTAQADLVVFNGMYQGQDIYVKNMESSLGVGFTIFEVLVNDHVTSDDLNQPVFPINFKNAGCKIGDPVQIIFRCKEKCEIRILNPEAIASKSTYKVQSMHAMPDGQLRWSTQKESGSLPFQVQVYKWKRWVTLAEIPGKGKQDINDYLCQIPMHSGENTLRLMQHDLNGDRTSEQFVVKGSTEPVQIKSTKVKDKIEFSQATSYEVWSEYGEVVAHGFGSLVDIHGFFPGRYLVNFDNQSGVDIQVKK
jgi:hypothetical protein